MKDKPKITNVAWSETRLAVGEEKSTHKHYFEWRDGECRCKFCPFGLPGVVEIVDGKPR